MARLILSMDGLVLKEIPLNKERLTIGRKSHNGIQIDNLAISGEHLALVCLGEDCFLEDLNSTNGTLVNGRPVAKCVLKDGDEVELGKYKLKYLVETPPVEGVPLSALGETALPGPGKNGGADLPLGKMRLLSGANQGRELSLVKPITTLGRPGVQVVVITRRPLGYSLTPVEGPEPPKINGQPVPGESQPLRNGDRVEVAGVAMAFVLEA